jgi:hypothetical protein
LSTFLVTHQNGKWPHLIGYVISLGRSTRVSLTAIAGGYINFSSDSDLEFGCTFEEMLAIARSLQKCGDLPTENKKSHESASEFQNAAQLFKFQSFPDLPTFVVVAPSERTVGIWLWYDGDSGRFFLEMTYREAVELSVSIFELVDVARSDLQVE